MPLPTFYRSLRLRLRRGLCPVCSMLRPNQIFTLVRAVLVFQGWIHPPSHWRGDIDAGWLDSRLDCPDPRWEEIRAGRLLRNYEVLREGARRTQKAREIRVENDKETAGCSAGEEWDAALGTIGAGNNFAELSIMSRCAFGTEASQHDFVRGRGCSTSALWFARLWRTHSPAVY